MTSAERSTLAELATLAEHELNMIDVIHATARSARYERGPAGDAEEIGRRTGGGGRLYQVAVAPQARRAVRTDWAFIASSQLGGDMFGYHWLDPDRLAIYLHDVCGHGVGASLLSIAVYNVLRRQSLPDVHFHEPAEVLAGLNRAFPMEENQLKFFTMWYGVFEPASRTLRYSSAGHPPALMFNGRSGSPERNSASPSLPIGATEDATFETQIASAFRSRAVSTSTATVFQRSITRRRDAGNQRVD